jgi:hypothetical protein
MREGHTLTTLAVKDALSRMANIGWGVTLLHTFQLCREYIFTCMMFFFNMSCLVKTELSGAGDLLTIMLAILCVTRQ